MCVHMRFGEGSVFDSHTRCMLYQPGSYLCSFVALHAAPGPSGNGTGCPHTSHGHTQVGDGCHFSEEGCMQWQAHQACLGCVCRQQYYKTNGHVCGELAIRDFGV
jgi:hypothetical protein